MKRLSCTRRHAALVEERRDLAVCVIIEELIDQGHDLRWRRPPGFWERHRKRACRTTLEADLQRGLFGFQQRDILDQKPHHPLAFAIWSTRIVPQTRKVRSKSEDARTLLRVEAAFALSTLFASILSVCQRAQLRVPICLERICDHAIVGIDLHIAPPRELGGILRIIYLLATQAIGFVYTRLEFFLDSERNLKSYRRNRLDEKLADCVVDTATVDDLARWLATFDPSALAGVSRHAAFVDLMIAHRHAFAADGADRETLQESRTFARRTFLSLRPQRVRVVAQPSIVLVEFGRADIARVRVGDICYPLLARETCKDHPAIRVFAMTSSTEAKHSCIARIMQYPQRARVVKLTPDNLPFVQTSIHASRELQFLGAECLDGCHRGSGAAEGLEEHPDCVLDPLVRIEKYAFVGIVDEADRQSNLKLSSPRFVQDSATQSRA